MSIQRTTNHSERDIDQQFKMAEFNRIFEENNLSLNKNVPIDCNNNPQQQTKNSHQHPNFLFIITCILIFFGISLLLFNNFINFS
jgi:hypothetical protein